MDKIHTLLKRTRMPVPPRAHNSGLLFEMFGELADGFFESCPVVNRRLYLRGSATHS